MEKKKKMPVIVRYLPVIIVFILILAIAIYMFFEVENTADSESLSITETNIRRAVMSCYAEEGRYPESIEYLKENYGLYISDDFIVDYSIFADNIMPQIFVMRKQVTN